LEILTTLLRERLIVMVRKAYTTIEYKKLQGLLGLTDMSD